MIVRLIFIKALVIVTERKKEKLKAEKKIIFIFTTDLKALKFMIRFIRQHKNLSLRKAIKVLAIKIGPIIWISVHSSFFYAFFSIPFLACKQPSQVATEGGRDSKLIKLSSLLKSFDFKN